MAKTNEIFPDDVPQPQLNTPSYEYGQSQEGIDAGRLRNLGWGSREAVTNGTIYYAKRPGVVKAQAETGQIVTITGYADTDTNPTTIVDQQGYSLGVGETASPSLTFTVTAGEYYKVDSTTGLIFAYFTSLTK